MSEVEKLAEELCGVYWKEVLGSVNPYTTKDIGEGEIEGWNDLAKHVLRREIEAEISGIKRGYVIGRGSINHKDVKDREVTKLKKELEGLG